MTIGKLLVGASAAMVGGAAVGCVSVRERKERKTGRIFSDALRERISLYPTEGKRWSKKVQTETDQANRGGRDEFTYTNLLSHEFFNAT